MPRYVVVYGRRIIRHDGTLGYDWRERKVDAPDPAGARGSEGELQSGRAACPPR